MPSIGKSGAPRNSRAIKPPIGLMPRSIHLQNRLDEIDAAIKRYVNEGFYIDHLWIIERNDVIRQINELEQK